MKLVLPRILLELGVAEVNNLGAQGKSQDSTKHCRFQIADCRLCEGQRTTVCDAKSVKFELKSAISNLQSAISNQMLYSRPDASTWN
jgi:hypothetical protein